MLLFIFAFQAGVLVIFAFTEYHKLPAVITLFFIAAFNLGVAIGATVGGFVITIGIARCDATLCKLQTRKAGSQLMGVDLHYL